MYEFSEGSVDELRVGGQLLVLLVEIETRVLARNFSGQLGRCRGNALLRSTAALGILLLLVAASLATRRGGLLLRVAGVFPLCAVRGVFDSLTARGWAFAAALLRRSSGGGALLALSAAHLSFVRDVFDSCAR